MKIINKPTKFPIYLNACLVPLYLAVSILTHSVGRPTWVVVCWAGGAVLMSVATAFQVNAYCNRMETYETNRRSGRAS